MSRSSKMSLNARRRAKARYVLIGLEESDQPAFTLTRKARLTWSVLAVVACAILGTCATLEAAPVDQERLLRAISAVETGHKARPGRSGETGAHQLMPAARQDNHDAQGHLTWLLRHLDDPTPYRLALAWNAGLTRVQEGRTHPRHHDHARRVTNVYQALAHGHPQRHP